MTFEQIIALLATLGVGTWIGGVIKQFLQNKGDTSIKKLDNDRQLFESEEKIKDLKREVADLMVNIDNLNVEVQKFRKLYEEEKENTHKAEQQLATINVAFDIIYAQLKNILGNDETHTDLLMQLKKYIDSGQRNT